MLQARFVAVGTRCDEQVYCRNRHARRASFARKLICTTPDILIDLEFRQEPLEIAQRLLFTLTACAIPEFQPHDRAPTGFARLKGSLDAPANLGVAIGAQEVNPGGGVNQEQSVSALAALRLKFLDTHQSVAGTGVLHEFGHALTPVEVLDRRHNRFPLRLGTGKSHGIRQVGIWNIYAGFHDSQIISLRIKFGKYWNPLRWGEEWGAFPECQGQGRKRLPLSGSSSHSNSVSPRFSPLAESREVSTRETYSRRIASRRSARTGSRRSHDRPGQTQSDA